MKPRARLLDALPLAALLLLGSCVAPPPRVVRVAPPVRAPAIVALPAPPAPQDWTDGPVTPGGWRYARGGATFGEAGAAPLFTLRCEPGAGQVTLARAGATATLAVTTTAGARAFALAGGAARLAAGDPFLDAMTFSRGRLLVRGDALAPLVLSAQAEIGRVVEDCRG